MRNRRLLSFRVYMPIIPLIVIAALVFGAAACDTLPGAEGEGEEATAEPPPGAPISGDEGAPEEVEDVATYGGVRLDSLDAYAATFEMAFAPDDAEAQGWTYALDILTSSDPSGLRWSLSMEGVPPEQDLGDATVTRIGDTQYMTGEATGEAGCLIFPASIDLETSFLTPDDLLTPDALADVLTPAGAETVAGQPGTRYTFEAAALGDFQNVSGDLVIADDGGYVLRYNFAGDTATTPFSTGLEGQVTWQFEITDLSPDETVTAPEGCEIPYPLMADATDLARLPGMVVYLSPSSPEDVQAFYEQALPEAGWGRYDLPATSAGTTVLVYAREGFLLNISITAVEGGTEVQLFTRE